VPTPFTLRRSPTFLYDLLRRRAGLADGALSRRVGERAGRRLHGPERQTCFFPQAESRSLSHCMPFDALGRRADYDGAAWAIEELNDYGRWLEKLGPAPLAE